MAAGVCFLHTGTPISFKVLCYLYELDENCNIVSNNKQKNYNNNNKKEVVTV